MARQIDRIDRRILDALQAEGRLSITDLAARVNLTATPCTERVRRLEREGLILGYGARVDPEALGLTHLTVVQVSMGETAAGALAEFNRAVARIEEVQSCLMIAGSFDYLLTVRTRDMAHFRALIGERISTLPGIRQSNSFAVMEVVKDTRRIAVEALG